jgi:hypothetical protein
MTALTLSARMNFILSNDEAEIGAASSDDLGKFYYFNCNKDLEAEDDDG